MCNARRPIVSATATSWICLLSTLSGCGFDSRSHSADPIQAVESVTTALNAWKAGLRPEDLSRNVPEIIVTDPDWQGGAGLIGFETFDSPRQSGYDVRYPVRLELKTTKGRSVKKTAVYTISTYPKFLIIREEG